MHFCTKYDERVAFVLKNAEILENPLFNEKNVYNKLIYLWISFVDF